VFLAFVNKISTVKNISKFNNTNTTFQLFGVDVAVNDKLNPIIMEVNKGPDLGAKDSRDGDVKRSVVKGIFNIIGAIKMNNCSDTGFLKLFSVKNGAVSTSDFDGCNL